VDAAPLGANRPVNELQLLPVGDAKGKPTGTTLAPIQ